MTLLKEKSADGEKESSCKIMLPEITIEEVFERVRAAAKNISDNQSEVWHMTEWNICHHLANALGQEFGDYKIDVELIKIDGRRPDIVIHHRGGHENNLVVFEVKKNPTTVAVAEDLNKIRDTFFNEPYKYRYGIFISIGKLPNPLPEFDIERIRVLEVYGWREMTQEEFEQKAHPRTNL